MLSANWFAVTLYGVQNITSWFFVVVHVLRSVSLLSYQDIIVWGTCFGQKCIVKESKKIILKGWR